MLLISTRVRLGRFSRSTESRRKSTVSPQLLWSHRRVASIVSVKQISSFRAKDQVVATFVLNQLQNSKIIDKASFRDPAFHAQPPAYFLGELLRLAWVVKKASINGALQGNCQLIESKPTFNFALIESSISKA